MRESNLFARPTPFKYFVFVIMCLFALIVFLNVFTIVNTHIHWISTCLAACSLVFLLRSEWREE